MFELVNDIEAYPEYMDGCQQAKILKTGDGWLEARLSLGVGGITQSFVTRNLLQPPHKMTLNLVEGPFRDFSGEWRFEPEGDLCKVSLRLEFTMQNPLLAFAANKMFERVVESQVSALCRRAREQYAH